MNLLGHAIYLCLGKVMGTDNTRSRERTRKINQKLKNWRTKPDSDLEGKGTGTESHWLYWITPVHTATVQTQSWWRCIVVMVEAGGRWAGPSSVLRLWPSRALMQTWWVFFTVWRSVACQLGGAQGWQPVGAGARLCRWPCYVLSGWGKGGSGVNWTGLYQQSALIRICPLYHDLLNLFFILISFWYVSKVSCAWLYLIHIWYRIFCPPHVSMRHSVLKLNKVDSSSVPKIMNATSALDIVGLWERDKPRKAFPLTPQMQRGCFESMTWWFSERALTTTFDIVELRKHS